MVDDGYSTRVGSICRNGRGIFGWLTLDNCSVTFCRRLYRAGSCMACMGMGVIWDILLTMARCKFSEVGISHERLPVCSRCDEAGAIIY